MPKQNICRWIRSSLRAGGNAFAIPQTTSLRVIAASLALAVSSASAMPVIYDLGTLGGAFSIGTDVNDAGEVAGWSAGHFYHAFRYDGTPGSGGVMRDLGTLGGAESHGGGINNAGQVAGQSSILIGDDDLVHHAFRYDGTPGAGGIMHDLGTLGGRDSWGHDLNNAGQVAGRSFPAGNMAVRAFRYDGTPGSGGVMRDLGTLGGTFSIGIGVNDAGQVTGESKLTGNAVIHAFRYDGTPGAGGVMRDLGTLGGTTSSGSAINNAGQVAGASQITGNTETHAFRYDGTPGAGGVMHDLGTLGGPYSQGYAINDAGQVAGYSRVTGTSTPHAFLYTGTPGVDGQMIDLDAWINANNPTEGAKWTLTEAYGLSNTGWITGLADYDPDGLGGVAAAARAFLMHVPINGDANSDGAVNSIDFGILAANYGALSVPVGSMGDFTFDNKVTTLDFNILAANFGGAPASPLAAAVPEPASFAVLALAAIILPRRRR